MINIKILDNDPSVNCRTPFKDPWLKVNKNINRNWKLYEIIGLTKEELVAENTELRREIDDASVRMKVLRALISSLDTDYESSKQLLALQRYTVLKRLVRRVLDNETMKESAQIHSKLVARQAQIGSTSGSSASFEGNGSIKGHRSSLFTLAGITEWL